MKTQRMTIIQAEIVQKMAKNVEEFHTFEKHQWHHMIIGRNLYILWWFWKVIYPLNVAEIKASKITTYFFFFFGKLYHAWEFINEGILVLKMVKGLISMLTLKMDLLLKNASRMDLILYNPYLNYRHGYGYKHENKR